MNTTFQIVYSLLKWIAEVTGFTYNEVNIIGYYIILPFVYVLLADRILQKHVLKILHVIGVTVCLFLIADFTRFSDWLFQESVDFLLSFQFLGWNYIVSSVLICVVFPAVVFIVMFHFAYPKFFPTIGRCLSRATAPPRNRTS
ncbi:MAG: hypothetical protein O3A87_01725 [Verrucomicrobia bacterium]|nr:hypothetical protein [Verrucomicrobiota bacterium]MDA1005190.1 hypothetical protein [Verrucomicrobiota bacterium]